MYVLIVELVNLVIFIMIVIVLINKTMLFRLHQLVDECKLCQIESNCVSQYITNS